MITYLTNGFHNLFVEFACKVSNYFVNLQKTKIQILWEKVKKAENE